MSMCICYSKCDVSLQRKRQQIIKNILNKENKTCKNDVKANGLHLILVHYCYKYRCNRKKKYLSLFRSPLYTLSVTLRIVITSQSIIKYSPGNSKLKR